jgi:hypothetical protein
MAALAAFIGGLFSSILSWGNAALHDFAMWLLSYAPYVCGLLVHVGLLALQVIILALIDVARFCVALLPACDVPAVDLTPFSATMTTTSSSLASTMCWLLPLHFLAVAFLCATNAVLAYVAISWALRWLKVIK